MTKPSETSEPAMLLPPGPAGDMEYLLQLDDAGPGLYGARLRAMAVQLWHMSLEMEAPAADDDTAPFPAHTHLLEAIAMLCAQRRLRQKYISPDLLGEPGWDMLLELYAASLSGKDISTTSLALISGVPTTTALRWIDNLSKAGLVERIESSSDRRVHYQALTQRGRQAMAAYFQHMLLRSDVAEVMKPAHQG